LLLPAGTRADEHSWTLSDLITGLAQDSPSTVGFSEVRRLQYLTEPLYLEGTLSFEPPARLERLVLRPTRERMIVDGDLLTIEASRNTMPARVMLSDHPALDGFITALRSVLAGDQKTLERIYTIELEGGEASWSLRLTPKSERLRAAVSEVRIDGAGHEIATVEVIETGGDRSMITISKTP
jgi:outer membrane lipoprotein-sorting protein